MPIARPCPQSTRRAAADWSAPGAARRKEIDMNSTLNPDIEPDRVERLSEPGRTDEAEDPDEPGSGGA
ncbi:hypothetical protein BFF94_016925 [Burkholderia catarinensis]|nr:hypothetical protein BFF94_016925 [Burkholderia catarinensis]